jgi:hypothetical protein
LVPLDEEDMRYAHRGSSAADGVFRRPLKTATLLQQLQLLADCVPLADLAGRTSRRPRKDGARHADKRALWTNLSIRKRLGMRVWRTPAPFLIELEYKGTVQK